MRHCSHLVGGIAAGNRLAARHIEGIRSPGRLFGKDFDIRIDRNLHRIVGSSVQVGKIAPLAGMSLLLVGNLRLRPPLPGRVVGLADCCSNSSAGSAVTGCRPARRDHLPRS